MSQRQQLDLLAVLGHAVFERNSHTSFKATGEIPRWLPPLLPTGYESQHLSDAFPFLEVFLPDAEDLWNAGGDRVLLRSDYWTQIDRNGNELHLRATAVLFQEADAPDRKLLVLESPEHEFQETQGLVQHAHNASLAYDEIAKLSRQLERATRAKSEFLARMSHEIRTPMNALLGMAELLAETPLNAEQSEYLRIFRRAGDNLLKLINDILDFSKVEAGQLELEHIAFDLADVLENVMEVIAVQAHCKRLELSSRIRPEVPLRLVGDPGRLRQILLNLLGNAAKFTDSGELTVVVDIDPGDPGPGALHFAVSDTGPGIPADRISTVFDSFTQADASTTRKFGGTGLGLTISKRFVELMGGRIWAESVPGAGTTMYFTARMGVQQEKPDVLPAEFNGLRCLIVDDNANHRGAAADILKRWGAQVVECNTPGAALDCIKADGAWYDVALVDGSMERFDDGFGLATRIAKEQRARRVIVMLTTDRLKDAARCRGASLGYVLKPVRRSELGDAIAGRELRHIESDTQPAAGRMLRILLADDSEDNRFLVRRYLKDSGYLIDEAENGAIAVQQFRKGNYDLVLTDVEMPVLDGYSATRQMRLHEKEQGQPATPILALTAHAFNEARERSVDAGCTDHLTKPIRKAALLDAIRRYTQVPQTSVRTEPAALEDWLQPFIAGYLDKRRRDVAKLRSAVERSDYPAVRMLGHQMAGTGASYGFSQITEVGRGLEQSALAEDVDRILVWIAELERCLAVSV